MAGGLTVKLKGIESLQKHFETLSVSPRVRQAVVKGTAEVLSTAKHYCPSPDTGALRNSIHMTVDQRENEVVGKVFAGSGHAMFVEFGTGVVGQESNYPRAAALGLKYAQYSWTYTPDGGETFYTTKGYRARPFMYPAIKQNKLRIKQLIIDALREDIRR